jgi:hypothetical protein
MNEKGELQKGKKRERERERKRERERERDSSPCNQHREELVPELPVGHRLPGLCVPSLEHRVEEALLFLFSM